MAFIKCIWKKQTGFETHFKNNLKEGKRIMYPDKRKLESIEGTYKNNVLVGDLKITEKNIQAIMVRKNITIFFQMT